MENKITLPIGMSNFTEIRKNHYYYIDKTGLIENLLLKQNTYRLVSLEKDK